MWFLTNANWSRDLSQTMAMRGVEFLFPPFCFVPNLFLDLKWVTAPKKNSVLLQVERVCVCSEEKQHLQRSECHVVNGVQLKSNATMCRCPINLPVFWGSQPLASYTLLFTAHMNNPLYYILDALPVLYSSCHSSKVYNSFPKKQVFIPHFLYLSRLSHNWGKKSGQTTRWIN